MKKKMIKDWMDEMGLLFYAVRNKEIIATARMNFAKNGEFEFEKEYDMDRFKAFYPHSVSTTSKLMVAEKFRKSSLTWRFVSFLYDYSRKNDIHFDFINVNQPLWEFYKKLGYRNYTKNFTHPEFGEVMPMVLVISDYDYLKKVKSPLLRNRDVPVGQARGAGPAFDNLFIGKQQRELPPKLPF